mmetsp:Transcript_29446/g.94989  ORF Transcript_29446/g.94989 Transcript_29446/m.94989 type:complete len:214 (-) Transcript_29446:70-711(-)
MRSMREGPTEQRCSWTWVPSPTSNSQCRSRRRSARLDAERMGDGLHAPLPRTIISMSAPEAPCGLSSASVTAAAMPGRSRAAGGALRPLRAGGPRSGLTTAASAGLTSGRTGASGDRAGATTVCADGSAGALLGVTPPAARARNASRSDSSFLVPLIGSPSLLHLVRSSSRGRPIRSKMSCFASAGGATSVAAIATVARAAAGLCNDLQCHGT